jgi:hypothetical protein
MSKKSLLILILHLSLVCGARPSSTSKSNSNWVFWYYSRNGNRSCGNYCYLVFSLIGAILLCICGCGCLRCYYIRKRYKSEDLEIINTDTQLDQLEHDSQITQQQLQYPPLVYSHDTQSNSLDDYDDNKPPSYENYTFISEFYKHSLSQESIWHAYIAGREFTRVNPPSENLPPQEHLNFIKELGGVEAWKFIPESSVLQFNIASVANDHIISFHAKLDAMMQTNYPFHDMEYSKLPFDNNITPINKCSNRKSVNTYTNSNTIIGTSPPPPSYTRQSFALQPPTDGWFYYYELTILTNPNIDKTKIAIGLATKLYPPFRHVFIYNF